VKQSTASEYEEDSSYGDQKETQRILNVFVCGQQFWQLDWFSHLGSLITSDGKSEHKMKRRTGTAKTAFQKMKNALT